MGGRAATATRAAAAAAGLLAALLLLAAGAAEARGGGRVPIKINDASSQYQYTPPAWSPQTPASHSAPVAHREPGPVSGPVLLYGMASHCYEHTNAQYRYEVCPFRNVTQRERTGAAGSLHVILGVWREYETRDGRYAAMLFDDGTTCGGGQRRTARVALECGQRVSLSDVSEPSPCVYEMVLTTPQACGRLLAVGGAGQEPDSEGFIDAVVLADDSDGGAAGDDNNSARVVIVPAAGGGAPSEDLAAVSASSSSPAPAGAAPGQTTVEAARLRETVAEQAATIEGMQACIVALARAAGDPGADLGPCAPYTSSTVAAMLKERESRAK